MSKLRDKKFAVLFIVLSLVFCGATLYLNNVESKKTDVLSSTSGFGQTINPGTLSVDLVDSSYVSVPFPLVVMSSRDFSFSCQTSTGTLGISNQQIYIVNPGATSAGWNLTIAASSPTALWESAGVDYDFNDDAGCLDGLDPDWFGGQMTINPSTANLAVGNCSSCTTNNISLGSEASFEEGNIDSITLMTGSSSSDSVGDWVLTGVSISQLIPAEQPPASDYAISLVLTITAQ
ncbi:hypothetical protein JW962_00440 [Candidatus Dojkabacteria bacterium]|nr:hypothetical protein [Candidatus Dojkabacteria bacterium]